MSVSIFKATERLPAVPDGTQNAVRQELDALLAEPGPLPFTGDRLLADEAMLLLIRLDRNLREARAQWNHDWFRRLMRIRPRAVRRLSRRWEKLTPTPSIRLGTLGRRYHANLACYLYDTRQ